INPTQQAEIATWKKNEATACYLLTQKIHDHTLMKIHSKTSVAKWWSLICDEFTKKGEYALTNACTHFLESKCPDKGDVRTFLDKLVSEQARLGGMGVDISDEDMCSMVIHSLP
ncbi:hypothetical protein JAAARDRAFT_116133, partial [Jaapia argillacea MUCL 33604]